MTQNNQKEFQGRPPGCTRITPEQIERARQARQRHLRENLRTSIDEAAIILALDKTEPYFITTNLYWDCNCETDYIRPREMLSCEECGQVQEDAPDSRIADMKAVGIHIDWSAPEAIKTLDEHNVQWRRIPTPQG